MSGIALWPRRYAAYIRAAWMVDLQYRADIALWLLWGITEPAIALGVWWTVAASVGGDVDGYTRVAFARYFFGVTLINQLTQAWDAWYIDHWIADGEMNHRLARPVAPIHESVADNIAYKARVGTIVIVVWLLTALVWPTVRVPVAPGRWALTAIAVILGAGIRFFNGFAVGLLAFWTTRAYAIVELQLAIGVFLSGQLAPIDLLPHWVERLSTLLWFPYAIAFPVSLLTGTGGWENHIARGFAGQLAWLAAWFVIYRVVWRNGLKRYGAVGG
ncbi:MAG TPA: ABC-2 family transporter protein [Gemmatimonadaceae bacterium]|nr:ABC-2 family transporter protein [Gemmatimonadaceae bacterium]